MPNRSWGIVLAVGLSVLAAAGPVQGQGYYNPKDDQYRLLGLRRAKEAYEAALAEHERKQALFDKNLLSQEDWEQAARMFAATEVDYQQALLAVIFERQYVSVAGAVKYQTKDDRKRVRLTLENTSSGGGEYQKLIGLDDELFRQLQPDVVNDVYVSLLNDEGAIMSQPYEAKIEALRYGDPVTLDFALLQDLDAVTVNLVYGNGATSSRKIYLQKDASVNRVVVQSQQFAQEVELGGSASYDLTLELFSGDLSTFQLEVVNLPPSINRFFVDPTTQARLSQFKFTEGTNTRRAALQVSMPELPSAEVPVDVPIPFYVLIIPRDQATGLGDLRGRLWSAADVEALGAGFVRLELVPRGVGRILVRAPQLYRQILPDETAELSLDVVNDGTRRLDNVRIAADLPLNWTREIDPPVISALGIGEEQRVNLRFTPGPGVEVGKYEVRIQTTSYADNQPIAGEDKTVTLEIRPRANWVGTALLLLFIVGLVAGLVVFGIRLSRR